MFTTPGPSTTPTRPYLLGESVNGFDCPYHPSSRLETSVAAQRATISYAAYRYLRHRFGTSVADSSAVFDGHPTRWYKPVNPPLDPTNPRSIDDLVDPDRWQKLALGTFVSKTGKTLPALDFETPERGFTSPRDQPRHQRVTLR